jgi:CheY-like chemotaxis protein
MAKIEILIVDDSPAFNHLTKLTLQRAKLDCNITEMSNGQRAISYLTESNVCPDVILLDINMPVMDGFDFLEEYIRSLNKCHDRTKIYILTSSSQEVDMVRVRSFNIVKGYFEKPLSAENLQILLSDIKTSGGI